MSAVRYFLRGPDGHLQLLFSHEASPVVPEALDTVVLQDRFYTVTEVREIVDAATGRMFFRVLLEEEEG